MVRVGALEDSGLVARRVGAMAPCTCATPAYLQRYGVPETLDALDGHVGVHYTSMNTGKARVWCFIDDGEPKTVAMKGAVSVNDGGGARRSRPGEDIAIPRRAAPAHGRAATRAEPLRRAASTSRRGRCRSSPLPNRNLPHKVRVFIEWLSARFERHDGLRPPAG
ncbi:LysR family regulatory protein [Burkholderia pseudomallei]|nr:LysR family regulatory protein [Burkholderia pseudomallei]